MRNSYIYNLGHAFDALAQVKPSNIALKRSDEADLDYEGLNSLSNRIADFLISKGAKKSDVVAILNNKTDMGYAIMIACLKIGVIYTNLDPKSPIERFEKMLVISSPKLVFYFEEVSEEIKNICETHALSVNFSGEEFRTLIKTFSSNLTILNSDVQATSPAYIMFTSGSTGFPKGVVISHQQVLNFIEWSKEVYQIIEDDVFTNINPMHFDNSVFDFYAALFTGATLIPISEELTRNPRKLLDELNKVQPTIWFSVPSMLVFTLNMRALKETDLPSLRIVTFGGEGFPKNQLRKLWNLWGNRMRFVNVYGPTECTCICSSYDVTDKDMENDELLPLGFMAPNFYGLVLNENGKQAEYNEIGELHIGGPNVGIGYYNSSEKTKEVFITNPLITAFEERVYKTGDLVMIDKVSKMHMFAGRKDNQIKRMGYRIELEEIENALNVVESIRESAVIFVNTDRYAAKIIACLNTEERDEDKIIKVLKDHLPPYMLPDLFFYYESLPKNQNGKIDRLKLKEEILK